MAKKKSAAKTSEQLAKLEEKLAKKKAQLRSALDKLRELENALDENALVSPFAPESFPELPPVKGVRLAAAEANVRYSGRLDVMLAEIAAGSALAGTFTRSKTAAAPVLWCQQVLAGLKERETKSPIGLLVNSGNANAFTGDNGAQCVADLAAKTAKLLKAKPDQIFLASTGVIGEPLPADKISDKLDTLKAGLDESAWEDAARAIMTTDTHPKAASTTLEIEGKPVNICGIAKGSGMIAPNMATMLVFIFTDAHIAQPALQRMVSDLCDQSFNSITVDGDTSTSDTLLVAATGKADHPRIENARSAGYQAFRRGLSKVMKNLALQVVKDGEGITKFVEITVEGAKSQRAARKIGLSIANSPLVKTAWAGEDPNWGRIIAAIGKSGEEADRDKLAIKYGEHPVASQGWRAADYDEATLADYMTNPQLHLTIDVGVGSARATVWTCDLTHRYISINADYRS
ncbi:MAG: bifunctional glutamate N-acetyltransferase/amino-acid acetyltransferase ArgJ [Neomegalonema sp.]|nr:bifunctional glutamate N-acetyltransferase/amino-acid acetyltransferase ArgJ [Neomegalonema sp.]